jgi:hypothetical protein
MVVVVDKEDGQILLQLEQVDLVVVGPELFLEQEFPVLLAPVVV